MENLISFDTEKIAKFGNIYIETINSARNAPGIRTLKVQSNFKKILSVFLTGYITEGQTENNLMLQSVHSSYNSIITNKEIKIYAAGAQSIEITIIGVV